MSFRNKWTGDKARAAGPEMRAQLDEYCEKGYLKDEAERFIDVDDNDDDDMVHAKQIQE